jgi:hypothetical protein
VWLNTASSRSPIQAAFGEHAMILLKITMSGRAKGRLSETRSGRASTPHCRRWRPPSGAVLSYVQPCSQLKGIPFKPLISRKLSGGVLPSLAGLTQIFDSASS